MEVSIENIVELEPLIKKAKEFYSQNPNIVTSDKRELIAKAIVSGLEKYKVNAVKITQFLVFKGDPDCTQIIASIIEKNIKIYVEIG